MRLQLEHEIKLDVIARVRLGPYCLPIAYYHIVSRCSNGDARRDLPHSR